MATSTTSLTNAEYRKVDAFSKSTLDLVSKSIALVEWSQNCEQAQNDTADIGNATHAALLEPEAFASDYVKMPKLDKRTNAGKAQAEEFEASMAHKTVLSADDYDMVIAMRDSVLAHPVARDLLTQDGVSEESIFFEIDGIKCKCRPDRRLKNKHIVVDVKTTDDVERFHFSALDYRYDVQDAFYSEGYFQMYGVYPRFVFVVVGKRRVFGCHPVRVFELEQEDKDTGRALFMADLERVKELQAFGCAMDVEKLKLPRRYK